MKGIILAGGTGSRLHPLTLVTNKHLLPVYDKPMIYYPLDTLIRSGIRDIMIVTGKDHGGSFMNLLGSGKDLGVRLHYALQDGPGGIAEALGLGEEFVHGDNLLAILGDNIIFDDISDQVQSFREGAKIFLKRVDNPQRFGVPVFDSAGKIQSIEEKPDRPMSEFAVTGLYMYDHSVFEKIRKLRPSGRGELEITDVNNMYLKENKLSHSLLTDSWLDAGTVDSLLDASITVRQRKSKSSDLPH